MKHDLMILWVLFGGTVKIVLLAAAVGALIGGFIGWALTR